MMGRSRFPPPRREGRAPGEVRAAVFRAKRQGLPPWKGSLREVWSRPGARTRSPDGWPILGGLASRGPSSTPTSPITPHERARPMSRPRGTSREVSRRDFLRKALPAAAVGFAFPTIVPASALGFGRRAAPSNRITLGVIGTGNQGFNDIRSFLRDDRVQIVAVCDVNREGPGYWDGKVGGREPARRLVEEHYAKDQPSGTYRGCDGLRRLSGTPRPGGHRRGRGLHAGPLARHPRHRGLQGGEGHLLPEAALADRGRRPGDELCGEQASGRLPDREPAALGPPIPARLRAGPQRPDRRPAHRPRRAPRRAARTTARRGIARSRSRSRRASTTTAGSARPPTPRMPRRGATSISAGSTTTPAAR